MTYLVFDNFNEAYVANAIISLNMRLTGNVTTQWSEIKQRNDGKYVILYPDEQHMTYVSGYTDTQVYEDSWFNIN